MTLGSPSTTCKQAQTNVTCHHWNNVTYNTLSHTTNKITSSEIAVVTKLRKKTVSNYKLFTIKFGFLNRSQNLISSDSKNGHPHTGTHTGTHTHILVQSSRLPHTHLLYCSSRPLKCKIQLPKFFSVSGANLLHPLGIWPLKRQRAMSSSSLDIPTSPARAYRVKFRISKMPKAQST